MNTKKPSYLIKLATRLSNPDSQFSDPASRQE